MPRAVGEQFGIVALGLTGILQRRWLVLLLTVAIMATMKSVGDVDLKKDARTALCKDIGKLCAK